MAGLVLTMLILEISVRKNGQTVRMGSVTSQQSGSKCLLVLLKHLFVLLLISRYVLIELPRTKVGQPGLCV
jgi:carbon starvation protein CstA